MRRGHPSRDPEPSRSDRRHFAIAQPSGQMLRRPVESTLNPAVAVVHEAGAQNRPPVVQPLLEGIEDEACMGCPGHPPADDPPREGVNDEGDVDEVLPGGDVGEILPANFGCRCESGEPHGARFGAWRFRQPVHDAAAVQTCCNPVLVSPT